jgi:methylmalonyl-CoA mutase C-terminal domain/subunit
MTVFPKLITLMKENDMHDVLLTGGGIIPEDDMKDLQAMGVGKLFAPGTDTHAIADYIREWTEKEKTK